MLMTRLVGFELDGFLKGSRQIEGAQPPPDESLVRLESGYEVEHMSVCSVFKVVTIVTMASIRESGGFKHKVKSTHTALSCHIAVQ